MTKGQSGNVRQTQEIFVKHEESQDKVRNFLSSIQTSSLVPKRQLYTFPIHAKKRASFDLHTSY